METAQTVAQLHVYANDHPSEWARVEGNCFFSKQPTPNSVVPVELTTACGVSVQPYANGVNNFEKARPRPEPLRWSGCVGERAWRSSEPHV